MFGKQKKPDTFSGRLVGEWRAETVSGDVHGAITAVFREDGTFLTRNQLDVRGKPATPVSQAGRYRVEPVDRTRFKLFMIDENGQPLSTSVRTFPDEQTMLTEIGRIAFRRATDGGSQAVN